MGLPWVGRRCVVCNEPLAGLDVRGRVAACTKCRLPHIDDGTPRPIRIDDIPELSINEVMALRSLFWRQRQHGGTDAEHPT